MKPKWRIFTLAIAILTISGCASNEDEPLLMCDLADSRESRPLTIRISWQDGQSTHTVKTDEFGIFSFSHDFSGEFAEIDFMLDGREFGVLLQKNKHVKMVIAQGCPIFSCDNKECNESCEAIRRLLGKENFILTDDCLASYAEKSEMLNNSFLKVRQYIANVSDDDLRARLSRRAQRLHKEYSTVIDILKQNEDKDEYNRHIKDISLCDDYLYAPLNSTIDSYVSSGK